MLFSARKAARSSSAIGAIEPRRPPAVPAPKPGLPGAKDERRRRIAPLPPVGESIEPALTAVCCGDMGPVRLMISVCPAGAARGVTPMACEKLCAEDILTRMMTSSPSAAAAAPVAPTLSKPGEKWSLVRPARALPSLSSSLSEATATGAAAASESAALASAFMRPSQSAVAAGRSSNSDASRPPDTVVALPLSVSAASAAWSWRNAAASESAAAAWIGDANGAAHVLVGGAFAWPCPPWRAGVATTDAAPEPRCAANTSANEVSASAAVLRRGVLRIRDETATPLSLLLLLTVFAVQLSSESESEPPPPPRVMVSFMPCASSCRDLGFCGVARVADRGGLEKANACKSKERGWRENRKRRDSTCYQSEIR